MSEQISKSLPIKKMVSLPKRTVVYDEQGKYQLTVASEIADNEQTPPSEFMNNLKQRMNVYFTGEGRSSFSRKNNSNLLFH